MSDNTDSEIESHDQLQNVIDQMPNMGILVVQGDWNAKVKAFADLSAMMKQMRIQDSRLLGFATCNDLVVANALGHHKASRRWMWHSPSGQHHNQTDYILIRQRF